MASPRPPVDRSSGAPAFLQLKQALRRAILDGSLAERLPSERELARLHGIAYMTARRAVDALVDEHLVQRVPGVGTFVCRSDGPIARSGNLGVVLAAGIRHGAANPFYGEILAGVLAAASRHGLSAFVGSTSDELMPRADDHGSRRKVDGLVAIGTPDPAGHASLAAAAALVPVVGINQEPVRDGSTTVWGDDREAGRIAARHLLDRGHRRIAWIGREESRSGSLRLEGFREVLSAAGVALPARLVAQGDYEFASGEHAAARLLALREPPQAIACANDAMACGALRAATAAGRRIPQDLALLGFDDLILDQYLPRALTSVGLDKAGMGAAAVEAVAGLLAGRAVEAQVLMPYRLLARETT